MKIRAAVLRECGLPQPYRDSKPLSIETLDLDPPEAHEVLIQVKAAGLCHSDLVAIDGERPKPMPMVLGHEAVGIICECGNGVDGFEVGDVVVPAFVATCGKCKMCATGRPGLCLPASKANAEGYLLGGYTRLHKDGVPIFHHSGVAAFSEYAVVSEYSLVKIKTKIPLKQAALFGCGVMTGVGSVLNSSPLQVGDTVAVIGLGGVGLSALMAASAGGASQIIGIDVNPKKLQMAKEFGATDVFNANDPQVVEKVKIVSDGGVGIAIEAAGVPSALELAFAVTEVGGSTVAAGLPNPKREFKVSHFTLVAHERQLIGSYMGSCIPSRDIPRFINMCENGSLAVDKLTSNSVALEELNEAFDLMVEGSMIRSVLEL